MDATIENASPEEALLIAGSFGCLVNCAVIANVSLLTMPFTRTDPHAAVAEVSSPDGDLVFTQFGPVSWLAAVIVSLVTARLLP